MHVAYETSPVWHASELGAVSAEFVGQIATAVWLGKMNDAAAHEALWSYSMACHPGSRAESTGMREALMAEYRRRRERQDACS